MTVSSALQHTALASAPTQRPQPAQLERTGLADLSIPPRRRGAANSHRPAATAPAVVDIQRAGGMPGFDRMMADTSRASADWMYAFDHADLIGGELDEIDALHASAPSHFLRGYLSAVLSWRLELALATGRRQHRSSTITGDRDFDLKSRLERRHRDWMARLDQATAFCATLSDLHDLHDSAPHTYLRGLASGLITMRMAVSQITGCRAAG